jgi:hypothetical protein
MALRAPSCHLSTDKVDLHNPSEVELLTLLRAVGAGRDRDLVLARAPEEYLEAEAGSAPGLLRVRKKKGAGREYLRARRELALAEAETVFSSYLAGDPDFDRGLKWEVVGWFAGNRGKLALALLVAGVAVLVLAKLGFRVVRVG